MALDLTPLLTEMSTRNISWGKGGRCVGLTTIPPSCADCLEIWEPYPPGTLRVCPGLSWDCFTFTLTSIFEPTVIIPNAQASSFRLQQFPHVSYFCRQYDCSLFTSFSSWELSVHPFSLPSFFYILCFMSFCSSLQFFQL